MKRQRFEFNFWPSFTDLMLMLILLLFVFVTAYARNDERVKQYVKDNERALIRLIASAYNVHEEELNQNLFVVHMDQNQENDITFVSEHHVQKIRFSTNILFEKDDYTLKDKGKEILKVVGKAIRNNIDKLTEIQIQGHADTDRTRKFPSNVQLAALRATEVFEFLKKSEDNYPDIDPVEHLMSVTSFGEYKPVSRKDEDKFSADQLRNANNTEVQKSLNRRIELLLFYKH